MPQQDADLEEGEEFKNPLEGTTKINDDSNYNSNYLGGVINQSQLYGYSNQNANADLLLNFSQLRGTS